VWPAPAPPCEATSETHCSSSARHPIRESLSIPAHRKRNHPCPRQGPWLVSVESLHSIPARCLADTLSLRAAKLLPAPGETSFAWFCCSAFGTSSPPKRKTATARFTLTVAARDRSKFSLRHQPPRASSRKPATRAGIASWKRSELTCVLQKAP
jgi:hypothetical protein